MTSQIRAQLLRWRLAIFAALALSPWGQAVASDLHKLASDLHVALLTPGFWTVVFIPLAENIVRSVFPTSSKGWANGTAARLFLWLGSKAATAAPAVSQGVSVTSVAPAAGSTTPAAPGA